jgi:hypothetical protein
VIDYAPTCNEGMHAADVVAAVAKVYGAPTTRADAPVPVGLPPMQPVDTVVAQWNLDQFDVALLQLNGRPAFRLILASPLLHAEARTAGNHEAAADLDEWAAVRRSVPSRGLTPAWLRAHSPCVNVASFIP